MLTTVPVKRPVQSIIHEKSTNSSPVIFLIGYLSFYPPYENQWCEKKDKKSPQCKTYLHGILV